MLIVDAQIHIWKGHKPTNPNHRQIADYTADDVLKEIIDHFGRPDAAWSNLSDLVAAAKHRNVALKATGAPSYSAEPYPHRDIHGHIRKLYDAFGPDRMFWGTDITRMPCPWKQCVTMFTEELPWLTAKDKELVMGRALCTWLDWKLPA